MASPRFGTLRRGLVGLSLLAACSLLAASAPPAAAANSFDVSGTILSIQGQNIVLWTSSVTGSPQPITITVSELKDFQAKVGDPMSLTVMAREFNTYLALGITGEGSFVIGEDC